MVVIPKRGLGDCIETALADSQERYLRRHANGRDHEVFLTSEIVGISINLSLTSHTRQFLYIEWTANRPWLSDTFGYKIDAIAQVPSVRKVEHVT
jgi:hypothetical protein